KRARRWRTGETRRRAWDAAPAAARYRLAMSEPALGVQKCIGHACGKEYPVARVLTACPACGELLDVVYDWPRTRFARDWAWFESGRATANAPAGGPHGSGVWRYAHLLPFWERPEQIVSIGEGKTVLRRAEGLARQIGLTGGGLYLQYEGLNPSGSFKDNGMAAAFTHAAMVGAGTVACASTGNTSASMAVYAAAAGLRAVVFIGDGKIALGKLSQALDYGALTLQIAGDFDACLSRVLELGGCGAGEGAPAGAAAAGGGLYLMNSVNPFRLEGQKTIMYRVLAALGAERGGAPGTALPDWIIVPGGNLGNCSAFGKAFMELRALGMIARVPRMAVINAAGAATLERVYNGLGVRWNAGRYDRATVDAELARMEAAGERASTIASAIEINRPVNLAKALRALEVTDGVVRSVSDEEILEHKALVGRTGLGCEPASAASVAGARKLVAEGVIRPDETVVCVLTGHQLKDPDATVGYHMGTGRAGAHPGRRWANAPVRVANEAGQILSALGAGASRGV
ncbi:MAG TPA: threonine synthase, partial [Phycisphaerales bacterium]|nr:threonine synthase [Phycisphaerales bacterium]